MEFCHIIPTPHLSMVSGRSTHLVLAHLIEEDDKYVDWYIKQKEKFGCTIIMDNSAFEMYKQGRDMYDPSKLIEMGKKINADYIVMTDYPGEEGSKTVSKAIEQAPMLKEEGFGTFFVPQSKIGYIEDLTLGFDWAARHPQYVDYIGVSILAIPNAYGVEKSNNLQRFLSRWKFMGELKDRGILDEFHMNSQKLHFLGMVDGPNEISLVKDYGQYIYTWDSSAAPWLGLHAGEHFDGSPTGRIMGKYEEEVNFNFYTENLDNIEAAFENMEYIDLLVEKHYGRYQV
tara:strand:- start:1754 stop:2611 length:858 start_codon:yes stop_codon:yes gene_type:complete